MGDQDNRDFFMALAFLASMRSKDKDRPVGACIVMEEPPTLVGLGYNGMPDGPGFKDSEMDWRKPLKHHTECHAEVNAIVSALRRQADLAGSTLYVTYAPCSECCKLILQSNIKKVVWAEEYDEAVKTPMRPIKQRAKRGTKKGKERLLAVEQYLKPLPEMTVKQYREYERRTKYDPLPRVSRKYTKLGRRGSDSAADVSRTSQREKEIIIDLGPSPGGSSEASENTGPEGRKDFEPRKVDLPKNDFFMAIALLAKKQSSSEKKVGACLVTVDPHRATRCLLSCTNIHKVLLPGQCVDHEEGNDRLAAAVCAESNAIMSAFRVHANLTSSILYVTSPLCSNCAKIAVQSGVKTVIYLPSIFEKQDKIDKKAVEEIFYRARIPYLEYQKQTRKRYIVLDLMESVGYLID